MKRWTSPLVGLAMIGGLFLGTIERATAQEASPVSGASACTVEPKPVDEMLPLWFGPDGTPVATPTTEPTLNSEAELPEGTPADDETVAAMNATMHEFFACFDAGLFSNAFSLLTDHMLAQFGPDVTSEFSDTPEEVREELEAQMSITPTADDILEPTVISDAREGRILADGRAGAIFESEGDAIFALFVEDEESGRWLLDGFADIIESEDSATPTS